MTPDAISDAAVEAAKNAYEKTTEYPYSERALQAALAAALPHLVDDRDAEIARLHGPVQKFDGQDDALRKTLAQAQAEIARLHGIIRKMVRLSPDNPDVENAALGILEKPYD